MNISLVLAALCVLALVGCAQAQDNRFFRTQQTDGRWWLIDPDGKPFISKGVTTVRYDQDYIKDTRISPYKQTNDAKYGSIEAWRIAAATRLMGWGFNSLGAWSDEHAGEVAHDGRQLAISPILNLGSEFVRYKNKEGNAWLHGIFPDVFDPEFEQFAVKSAMTKCAAHRDNPHVLGWFSDNELRWGPDWRGKDELLTMFLALPSNAPGRHAAVEMLQRRHVNIGRFNEVWKTSFASWDELNSAGKINPPVVRREVYMQNQETERQENEKDPLRAAFVADCEEFVGMIAELYFSAISRAIRTAAPNHLNFGARFAYVPPKPVIDAAAKYLDVVSFNCYNTDPRGVIRAYSVFGKPLIIGEFSFRGKDSGLPNTRGAGPVVETQQDRASAFAKYVTIALSEPNLVGYHWFEHADEPKEGRFDGEDSNYGVVNIKDEPYELLVREMTRINAAAEELHRNPE